MKLLKLTQEKFAMVDDDDFENLSKFKWHFHNSGYAMRHLRCDGRKSISKYLHHEIMGRTKSKVIDHINGDKLDNRRVNLRFCTVQQNSINWKRCNSFARGVFKNGNKWTARIKVPGSRIVIGTFNTLEEAASAYDVAAKKLHGDFAVLNF